jgi:outer membrane protein OmpA-like peptidoglycan-associated protein
VNVEGNAIGNARVIAILPAGLEYAGGSTRIHIGSGAAQALEPKNTDGVLTFALDALPVGLHTVTFHSRVTPQAEGGIAVKSYLMFDSPSGAKQVTAPTENRALRGEMSFENANYRFSPRFEALRAELSARDREQLDKLANEWRGVRNMRVSIVGHTDSKPITPESDTHFKDNYELSRARAEVVAEYLRARLDLSGDQISIDGKGPDQPLATGTDAASMASNRRVEIAIEGMRVQSLGRVSLVAARSEAKPVVTEGLIPGLHATAVEPTKAKASSEAFNVESLQPGVDWLVPQPGAIPAISSVKVAIAHGAAQSVELSINGAPVSALNFDGVTVNQAKTVAVSRWIGIDLLDGENHLQAIVRDANGDEVTRLTREVHFAGGAVRAELVAEQSNLIADGKTKPIIALRMFDAYDKPARPGMMSAFNVDAPYRSQSEVDALHDNPLLAIGKRQPTFRVDDDGLARIELEPTTQSGNAMLHLQFNDRQTQDLRVWLKPQARDWVLVGIAEGTGAYKTIADNMQNAQAAGVEDGYSDNGRVAFFAKGRIKGEFLLTMAFDSARERNIQDPRLLGTIEPDRYYTVYGDGTEQRFEAASQEKLYVKLERNQFMAMFGDFETGLTVTELSRYSRTLTGVKSDYAGDRFSFSTFAAQTDQGFLKDELLGDGTSGLYRLSSGNLIANSDKVRIETRDRFRSEVIVESRLLTRYVDYSIDTFNGTLYFKQPIPSRDQNFNPVYIIAEYEVLQGGAEQIIGGGRAAMKLAGDRVEVGASYMQEGADAGDTRLAGTDVQIWIDKHTSLRGEVARSESDNPLRAPSADAYFTELKHVSERVDASVYFREQQAEFGFGQLLTTESGTRKSGVDGRVKLGDTWALRAEAYDQSMLNTAAERQMASAEVRHETTRYGVGLGAQHVSDAGLAQGALVSDLASLNGNLNLWNDRVILKGAYDRSLDGAAQSIDFPARSMVGVDYKLSQATTLFSEYEHSDGAQISSDMTRVGMRTTPWQRAQLSSTMNQQFSEFGPRVFANLGLTQGWQINDRWAMDFGVDQTKTVRGSDLATQASATRNIATPLASGSLTQDFLASSIAAMYRSENWTFTSRVEHRDSDSEQRWAYIGGWYREAIKGQMLSLQANWLTSEAKARGDLDAALVRFSWAYRPVTSEWIVLDRLEVKRDTRQDTLGAFESARIVNNLNSNWQLDTRTQLGVQFGARFVRSTFDGERYSGFSDLYGLDLRRDLTARLDIGVHGTWMHSWNAGTSDVAAGIDLGITVARNMWISVGYNAVGFDDKDYSASRYTAQGPFIKLRMKFDQDTFKDLSLESLRPSKSASNTAAP